MDRLSDRAIDIVNNLHTERLDYNSEYLPLINALNQFAAYEDTCYTPAEIADLAVEKATAETIVKQYEEWEQDGTIIRLPCKVGDTVWEFKYGCTIGPDNLCYVPSKACGNCKSLTCSIMPRKVIDVADAALLTRRWGKTIFCSHEEAEAALGGDGDGK